MKKIAIYGLTALMGVAFASCDNYEEPNPQPQTNPQGVVLQADQVSLANAIEDTYNLESLSQAGDKIVLATITAPDLGEYYSYAANVEMSGNGFARSAVVPSTVVAANEEGTLYNLVISPDDLQGVYYSIVSKGPSAKDVEFRYQLLTRSSAGQVAYIGGEDNIYGPYTMNVTPFPSTLVIEENYYLVGTACDWTIAQAIKLNHSDLSPYDDPVFTAKFDVFEGWWWKIIPESTFVTGDWASGPNSQFGVEVNGDESLSGLLMAATESAEPNAGCLNVTGPYLLTINMEELTYSFEMAIDNLYTPGGSNGWNQTASQLLTTDNYADYYGFAHLNGEFKFTSAPNWDGVNFGAGAEAGQLSNDGGAGNIDAGPDGLYYCKVNISNLTYSLTSIGSIGIIGDATPNGWGEETALVPSADFLTWSAVIDLTAGELKFRCNNDWTINLGGEQTNLVPDGANVPSPGTGKYKVVLHLDQLPYSCEFIKQ